MSISSYTTVTMLDSRPAQITISVPKSTDITNRIITFKDLYGSASNSTIILVTRSGDSFEDGTFSTIMSNAYQTVNLYAGLPGKWLNVGSTGSGGGDSAGLTTVSNRLNGVSTNVTTISTNLNTLSNNLTTVSNSTGTNTTSITTVSNSLNTVSNHLNAISTNLITVSTSLNTVSNTVAAGRFPSISTNTISTSLIRAGYISSPQGYISSLIVDSLAFSFSNSFIVMGDIITTSVSTIQTFTSSLTTNNLKVGTVSTLSYIAFPGLQQGYAQTVIAEQATGTGVQELLVFKGSTNTDRIRMQTTGPIVFEPGVSARVFPNTSSNVTPAMIINTSSNVGIGTASPGVTLDVVGAGRFTAVSTMTISSSLITSRVISRMSSNVPAVSVSPLAVTNGLGGAFNGPQIEFQYFDGGYKHFMGSRHNGNLANSNTNSIDFYLYSATSGGASASTAPGTCNVNTMSVTAAGVGILNNAPTLALDVAGGGRFISLSTNTISTSVTRTEALSTNTISTNTISTNTIYAGTIYGNGTNITGITSPFMSTATSDLDMNGNYLKDLTGNLYLSSTSINLHTSSIQQYLNYIPVSQPIIQFGSWSAGAANSDSTGGPYTVPITNYDNTTYSIYVTGKYTTISVAYSAVPVDGSNFNVYFVNGDQSGSNIFYWQTMGYYGANAGPGQGSGGGT